MIADLGRFTNGQVMLDEAVARLLGETQPTTDRIVVLIAPPLDEARRARDLRQPWWHWPWNRRRPKEFASRVAEELSTWELYRERLALPVLRELRLVRETTRATILPNARFRQFVSTLASDAHDVIFLIAHHYGDGKRESHVRDGIEFADGTYEWPRVVDAIQAQMVPSRQGTRRVLVLMVCEGTPWAVDLRGTFSWLSVGALELKGPLLGAVILGREWIRQCDGTRTFSDALDAATRVLLGGDRLEESYDGDIASGARSRTAE